LKTLTFIGANGFIGKSFVDFFNKGLFKKYNIKRINLISRNIKELKKIKNTNNIYFIKGDISRIKNLPKSDYIIYGAEKAEIKKKKNYDSLIKESKKSIDNFCEIIKKYKNVKVLYISSGIVNKYRNKFLIKKKIKSQSEAYTIIKCYSEFKIKNLSLFNIKSSIARCYTFIGRWLPRNSKYAIGNFIESIVKNKPIVIKKKNKVIRSYMYADDMVQWLTTICLKSKIKTSIYDVGSNYSIEIEQLANLFSILFNHKIIFNKSNYNYRKVDKYLPDINKSHKKLNLKLTYDLKKSILLTIKEINESTN
tara:strand:+ start:172 stop:1095 length:924 start_codon:yes stop_codon:yes gene_type:complete